MQDQKRQTSNKNQNNPVTKITDKISSASNILVAVSKDPTVDELSAALGLTLMLDSMGKHATAIYSGQTPDALKFLSPDKTFETNTNSLQDFIIALSKDKADHLRYKVDGDYVKVYITPYRTVLDESDLEFSHGDYNVDLVIGISVPSADDLDSALYEHGRILHDAGSVNITNKTPGKLGEVEWSEPGVSAVSEMVAELVTTLAKNQRTKVPKEVATALLTGIVANTERFLNDKTTPKAMDMASKLMQLGANQQLVSSNLAAASEAKEAERTQDEESGELEVDQTEEDTFTTDTETTPESTTTMPTATTSVATEPTTIEPITSEASESSEPISSTEQETETNGSTEQEASDLAEAENNLSAAERALNEMIAAQPANASLDLNGDGKVDASEQVEEANIYPKVADEIVEQDREKGVSEPEPAAPKDYGQMIEEALIEPLPNPAAEAAPTAPTSPELNHIPEMDYVPHTATTPISVPTMNGSNDYLTSTPQVAPPTADANFPAASPIPTNPVPTPTNPVPTPTSPVQPEPAPTPVEPTAIPAPIPPVAELVLPQPEVVLPPPPAPTLQPEQPQTPQPQPQQLQPQSQFQPQPQTVSELEQANDPSAFRIPGMPT